MKATNEQIMTTAAILLAGAMSGDEYSHNASTRIKYRDAEDVQHAIRLAKLIAENIEEE